MKINVSARHRFLIDLINMAMYLRVWSPSAYANGADCVSFGTGSAALFTALRHVKWSIPTSFGLANEVDAFFNHFLTNLKKEEVIIIIHLHYAISTNCEPIIMNVFLLKRVNSSVVSYKYLLMIKIRDLKTYLVGSPKVVVF